MLSNVLLVIAKSAILQHLHVDYRIDKESILREHPYLSRDGASFVTLEYEGDLRGCIGSVIARRPLFDDIYENAVAAAFNDPRFNPVRQEELSHLTLEVSLLSAPKLLQYDDFNDLVGKIRPHKDGLILRLGQYQGTFLPQVWEQLPIPESFLEHLSYKAGANPGIYKEHPDIYTYQVDAIKDRFDNIQS